LKIRIDRGTRGLNNTGTRYRLVFSMTDSRLGILVVHFTWFSGLTGAEIAGRALKAKERGEQAIPNTPSPADPSQRDCIEMYHTLNLQPPLLPSLPSCSPSSDIYGLPPSTAPTWLQEERGEVEGKRKHKIGEAYYKARTAELLSLSYSP
jgi:hypothetical protein